VCPIISLIQDQELNAHEFGIDRVGRIESQMDRTDKNRVLDAFGKGKYFFIWISPERFQTIDFRRQLSELSKRRHFGYAVIDEVHCLSEWGHDFRVSYLKLYGTIKQYCSEAQIIALTATASRNVLEDLLSELEITKANVQTSTSLDRPELKYHIVRVDEQERDAKLDDVLDQIDLHFRRAEGVKSIFEPRGKDSICGIIFSNLRDNTFKHSATCEGVLRHLRGRGILADSYHSGREDERTRIQEEFLDNQFTVMSATKAFGMGVNKKNIRYTIHNGLPWSIEAFYQEAGRAGRDPAHSDSECYILYSNENDPDDSRRLFEETTTVDEIIGLQSELVGDLDTLFFLWSGNHEDLQVEREAIVETFKWLYRRRGKDGHVIVKWNLVKELTRDAAMRRARERARAEKRSVKAEVRIGTQDALYKLAILGIVIDWTVDYNTRTYNVEMREVSRDSESFVRGKLQDYIRRHDPTFSFSNPSPSHSVYVDAYRKAPAGNKLVGLIDTLLIWTSDNIVFSRRRAIGNMLDLCESDRGDQEIREYINSYFRLDTESNDQLDAIVRDTKQIGTWMRLFTTYELTDDPAVQKEVLKDARELAAIAALCDRYRESFHANIGLEWSTMMAKLLSGTFTEWDVQSQFEFVVSEIGKYPSLDANELFEGSLAFLVSASDEAKDAFGSAVVKHAPGRALQTYKMLRDVVTLAFLVREAGSKLKSTWRKRSER
jgi:ATP-dependent DNA helicase RecQ